MNKSPDIVIYTDGSCWNGKYDSDKTASAGFALIFKKFEHEETGDIFLDLSRKEELIFIDHHISLNNHGTSNLAEIKCILDTIMHIVRCVKYSTIEIRTDSKYAIKVFKGNSYDSYYYMADLLNSIVSKKRIKFTHIPRDSGNPHNKACDKNVRKLRLMFDAFLNDPNNQF